MSTESTPEPNLFDSIVNPALREALRYRSERMAMNNPKGWHHVFIVLRDAYSAGAVKATDAQYHEARAVLAFFVDG